MRVSRLLGFVRIKKYKEAVCQCSSLVLNQESENPEGLLANLLGHRVSVAPTQLSLLRSKGHCTKGGAHSNEAFSKIRLGMV